MRNELAEELYNLLRQTQRIVKFSGNKKDIVIRCPICGDSTKSRDHAHFYIKVPNAENDPFVCYCQRCYHGGIIDLPLLKRLIDGGNSDFLSKFNQHQRHSIKIGNKIKSYFINKPLIIRNKPNKEKLDYINNRLGLDFTYDELSKYKIFLSIDDLLRDNYIEKTTQPDYILDIMNEHYIGFVSMDNTYVIMRYIGNDSKMPRYRNYSLYNIDSNLTNKFYVLPNQIDLMSKRLNLVISEGVFDILGVYHHVKKEYQDESTLYMAVCGIGYYKLINFVLGLGFLDLNIEIYADSDSDIIKIIKKLKEKPFLSNTIFNVSYNIMSKDFGVPKNKIKIKSFRM